MNTIFCHSPGIFESSLHWIKLEILAYVIHWSTRLTQKPGSDHYFRTDFHPYVRTFQNISKQNILMITTGGTVGLAEGIIDDTCLVIFVSIEELTLGKKKLLHFEMNLRYTNFKTSFTERIEKSIITIVTVRINLENEPCIRSPASYSHLSTGCEIKFVTFCCFVSLELKKYIHLKLIPTHFILSSVRMLLRNDCSPNLNVWIRVQRF